MSQAINIHGYRDGEKETRYHDLQVVLKTYTMWNLPMQFSLLFDHVMKYGRASVAYDAQNQRIENVAIEDEQNFWQPPPEP